MTLYASILVERDGIPDLPVSCTGTYVPAVRGDSPSSYGGPTPDEPGYVELSGAVWEKNVVPIVGGTLWKYREGDKTVLSDEEFAAAEEALLQTL